MLILTVMRMVIKKKEYFLLRLMAEQQLSIQIHHLNIIKNIQVQKEILSDLQPTKIITPIRSKIILNKNHNYDVQHSLKKLKSQNKLKINLTKIRKSSI
jgi:hypothetical protein